MRCNRNTRRLLLTGDRSALALVMPGSTGHLFLKIILQGSLLFRRGLLRFSIDFIKLQACEFFF